MNYKKIYDSLIIRGKTRLLQEYSELHHIVPRCIGGNNEQDNLVRLTPEEHYVAHQLLVKIYPNNPKLIKAAAMMIPNRPSNKLYGWLRRKFAKAQSAGQTGTNNSQHGSRWIHNPVTGETKKTKNKIIEAGWVAGRYPKKPKLKTVHKKTLKSKELELLYNNYHELYIKFGFEKFVEITGYNFSKQNLVQMLTKYVKDFIPQNGKKRG